MSRRVIGIDLGTTNSALAWAEPAKGVQIYDVPQVVAPGESGRRQALPSFLYMPSEDERQLAPDAFGGTGTSTIVGVFARDHGALIPRRQVSSAKSWLANPYVDRRAPLLPFGADEGPKLSPVEASTAILRHLRWAWNRDHAQGRAERSLEQQSVVLTVPASFDEEARELTVEAARAAGIDRLTLLEEPLAALYAWMAAHRRAIAERLAGGTLILVCDVGGGTTDFSVIRASTVEDDVRFERVAIGEHLLLGGDNLDAALASLVEHKLGAGLSLSQRQILRRKCTAAKEVLLSGDAPDRVPITIPGSGRGLVGGGLAADLTRDEALQTLAEGFLPVTPLSEVPARDRRVGLRELGLPFEREPAITKHLAAFLTRAGTAASAADVARPDAILFNGGFFIPPLARERVLDALTSWFGVRPMVLETARPETAVALGAAFYGRLRQDPGAARRLIIRAGSARAYYVGVETAAPKGQISAICVMPRGTDEGTSLSLDREFTVTTNQPVAFTLYSSIDRPDPANALVTFDEADAIHRHAPLVTVLRFGKRSRRVPLSVRLTVVFTETGTLELWCESTITDHRWRLSFNLRGLDRDDSFEIDQAAAARSDPGVIIVCEDAIVAAEDLLRKAFGGAAGDVAPESVTGAIEQTFGLGKHAWPIAAIRRLADVLLELADGRQTSTAHEGRWLNLTGFCVRPGFGGALDAWRISELRKVYAAGLAFPRDVQCQVEWLVLWQRVGAGFSNGQQRELAQRVIGQLGLGQRKPPRVHPQIEREGWRLLASLERLDQAQRVKLGDELLNRIRRDPATPAWLWAIGRLGARVPFHGPLNAVVPAAVAERWIGHLLGQKRFTLDTALAIVEIGARTDDPARDISGGCRTRTLDEIRSRGVEEGVLATLEAVCPMTDRDRSRTFGESLPEGLRLAEAGG